MIALLTQHQRQHATFHAACFRLWLLITARSLEPCSEAGISSDMAHNYSEQVGLHEKTHAFLFPTPGPKCADVPLRNYSLTLPAQYNCCNKIMSCKHKTLSALTQHHPMTSCLYQPLVMPCLLPNLKSTTAIIIHFSQDQQLCWLTIQIEV